MCYRARLKASHNSLNDVGKVLESAAQRIYLSNLALADLRHKVKVLKETAASLKANATHLQESNVEGKQCYHGTRFKRSVCKGLNL